MNSIRIRGIVAAALIMSSLGASSSMFDTRASKSPFRAHVDMQTFMEHVLTPAAQIIWSVNGSMIDEKGEHDLSPRSDDDWEKIVSGAATLAEANNALRLPERARDAEGSGQVKRVGDAAGKAYRAAEAHDLKSISEVSDELDGVCAACHRHYGLE